MQFKENPYYSPDLCGLQILESVDTAGAYEFNMLILWAKLDDGTLWWDRDSGCSCPIPFENDSHDLQPVTLNTFSVFEAALDQHYDLDYSNKIRFINTAKKHLKIK